MSSSSANQRTVRYSSATVNRAERALRCSPFKLSLFAAMRNTSVPLQSLAGQTGIEKGYSQKNLSEGGAEGELMWLIKVGLLRREVDGQGITDSFRLTPLGRQLVAKWEPQREMPAPSALDRLYNTCERWLR